MSGGTSGARLSLRGTSTSAYAGLGEMHGFWDTNKVASILFHAGADTSNKDDIAKAKALGKSKKKLKALLGEL